jgi:hypothetical protein
MQSFIDRELANHLFIDQDSPVPVANRKIDLTPTDTVKEYCTEEFYEQFLSSTSRFITNIIKDALQGKLDLSTDSTSPVPIAFRKCNETPLDLLINFF